MTASEKLQQLIENDKLTDKQQDNLDDWGIQRVSGLKECLIDMIKDLQNDTDNTDYKEDVIALYYLLDYKNNDYVIYDENGVTELDFDTLNDALDTDYKIIATVK